ncbi:hypothetical protein [Actinoallomurus iriomotensis]|uniref:Uncharacterized protein n=1 Tax=Actinoallomurus iriomotensis TaxID=478107 RepID=A0A9W6VRV0_9ACTN|nr:hypothetical protein [Actinoallomurus iriomotensis]GLY77364.1 hypothetical protein Airi01_056310 [Actinoallomurus iriomotensis]
MDYNAMLLVELPQARRRADEAAVTRICATVAHAVTEQASLRYEALWRIDDQDAVARICVSAGRTFASRGSFGTAASFYRRGLRAARAVDDRRVIARAASALAALAPGIERETGAFTHELLRLHNARTAYRDAVEAFDLIGRDQAAVRSREHATWCDARLDDRLGGRPFTDADAHELFDQLIEDGAPCPYLEGLAVPAGTDGADELPTALLEALEVALGAQLREPADQASHRIRRVRDRRRPRSLEITVPGTPVPTLLVLPRPATAGATAALADLDLAGEASRGHELSWDRAARTWQIHGRPAPRLSTADRPPASYEAGGRD